MKKSGAGDFVTAPSPAAFSRKVDSGNQKRLAVAVTQNIANNTQLLFEEGESIEINSVSNSNLTQTARLHLSVSSYDAQSRLFFF